MRSIITAALPLSAGLMTIEVSSLSSFSAVTSWGVRFCLSGICGIFVISVWSDLIKDVTSIGSSAVGGSQVDGSVNRCFVFVFEFPK